MRKLFGRSDQKTEPGRDRIQHVIEIQCSHSALIFASSTYFRLTGVVRLALIAHMSETWTPLPDPISEEEVKIELNWTADERTTRAIDRQAKLMGVTANNTWPTHLPQ
jgi:hypothetical protein